MVDLTSIIVAVASPPGSSLRGIVRLSGAGTCELVRSIVHAREGSQPKSRGVVCGTISLAKSDRSVPVIVLLMPGPRSYTGEDSAELHLTGNPILLEHVVDELIDTAKPMSISVRRAHAGEFTARAFLNGRISLTQAEGVAVTIAAQSDAELRAGQMLISGSLGTIAHDLANDLAAALALVEAGIDFTDQDDVVAISPADLFARLQSLRQRIADQLEHAVGAEQLEAIPWVVLVGEPNAGKSALFNALLGHERAVVSPIVGTTRDVLTEPLTIETDHGPAEVMLVDLAGIDADENALNQHMQSLAKRAIERAELILRCLPAIESAVHAEADELLVRTKADLISNRNDRNAKFVSAITHEGLDALRSAIAQRLANRAVSLAANAAALWPRHEAALRSALANLDEGIELVRSVQSQRSLAYPELIASTMRAALDDLAALAGDISPDDVLGRVFATFCVGK